MFSTREQIVSEIGYMRGGVSLEEVNNVLSKFVPVSTLPFSEKLPYGKKEASIKEQYENFSLEVGAAPVCT